MHSIANTTRLNDIDWRRPIALLKRRFSRDPIFSKVWAATKQYPGNVAVECDGSNISYAELERISRSVAYTLQSLGIRSRDRVGLMLPNGPDFVCCFVGITRFGGVVLPLDLHYAQPELERLLTHAGCTAVITNSRFIDTLRNVGHRAGIKDARILQPDDLFSNAVVDKRFLRSSALFNGAEQPLAYLCSGGTVGLPKPVLISHRIAWDRAMVFWGNQAFQPNDIIFNLSPLFRGPALLMTMLPALMAGATLKTPTRFDPDKILDDLTLQDIKVFHANPYHVAALAEARCDDRDLSHIRCCLSSGNRLPASVRDRIYKRFKLAIRERYGTLEVGGIARNGRVLPHVKVRIVDDAGGDVTRPESAGEIVVRTPWMVSAYEGMQTLSRNAFRDGWFYTGDIGYFTDVGQLKILKRSKTAAKRGDRLVYADEIRQILLSHHAVFAASVHRDSNHPDCFTGYAVVDAQVEPTVLLRYCRERMGVPEALVRIEIRPELPRSWKTEIADDLSHYPRWGGV